MLWAKGFAPPRGEIKQAVVAIADSPLGPFELTDKGAFYSPAGTEMADATLYVDGDETWLFWRTVTNITGATGKGGFMVAKLNSECTALESEAGAKWIADIRHEAPAVFKAGGKAYVWTSSTTGFRANSAKLLVSVSGALDGPYVEAGNPTHDPGSFSSQSTYILPNPAFKQGSGLAQFIFIADRWQPNTTDFGRYLWLPLEVDSAAPINDTVAVTNPGSWMYGG